MSADDQTAVKPLLIYDGKCGFCAIWVHYWKRLTDDRVLYAPAQDVGGQHPEISPDEFKRSVWLVFPTGERWSGAEAAFRLMSLAPGKSWMLFWYRHAPGFAPVSEAAYRFIARHRSFFYWVTRILWGKEIPPASHRLTRSIFLRGLALVYFIAFVSLVPQIVGLIGAQGIAPAGLYLDAVREQIGSRGFWFVPTLVWFNSSDAFLRMICWVGAALSVMLFLRIAPLVSAVGLWALYLSIVAAGQDFLSFQWDGLLLEAGFAAILLAPAGIRPPYRTAPSGIAIWVLRFLAFRLMIESGMVKLLSGDPEWRSLNALSFHFETQPLPTPVAWYAHHLPAGFQRVCVFGVFAVELAVPMLFLMPRKLRIIGAWITIVFQMLIAITGNYAFFNLLTILLCVPLLDDHHLRRFKPFSSQSPGRRAAPKTIAALGLLLISMGSSQILAMLGAFYALPGPIAWLDSKAEIFRVVNRYGLFAIMTTSRLEIVIEGSDGSERWLPYEFKFKPGDVTHPPRWVAPHQPRLDWQMWFAALSTAQQTPWFSNLMLRLLQGSPDVQGLLKTNPFPNAPPRSVRAVVYDYHFSDAAERRRTGAWWTRRYAGVYFRPASIGR